MVKALVSAEERAFIAAQAQTTASEQDALGYLALVRQSSMPLAEIHARALAKTTRENHHSLCLARDLLTREALRFGLKVE